LPAIVALYDIKFALLQNEYPETLVNKCFEVEIVIDSILITNSGEFVKQKRYILMKKSGLESHTLSK
jgi:hypothetical protein